MAEVVNRELEKLERAQAEVPNGELLDLYSIRPGVLLYGVSIAGDDYIRGPLFYEVNDALLHALHTMYQSDTVGSASPEKPANHPDTNAFHFNSPLRIKEYTFDNKALFYDARNKNRPACSSVGTSNFKVLYFHLLPDGKDRSQPTIQAATLTTDAILANITERRSSLVQVVTEAFYFCSPGKTLRIEKSYSLNMGLLWMYYVTLLRNGGEPKIIRSKIFNRENGFTIAGAMISDKKIPSTIGSLPAKVDIAIKEGKSLTDLIPICSLTILKDESCSSGIFFEKLWKRDVPYIKSVYGASSPKDKENLLPVSYDHFLKFEDNALGTVSWFYQEDFQPDAGRDNLVYNWNYNRYLDVNTVIFWLLRKMTVPPDGPKNAYNTGRKPALDLRTVQMQISNTPHRFTMSEINKLKLVSLYDSMSEIRIELGISSINPYGLIIKTALLVDSAKTRETRDRIWAYLEQLLANWGNLMVLGVGPKNLMNQVNSDLRYIAFVPPEQSIQGLYVNWLLLPIVSNLLRYLIGRAEFSFITFA